MSNFREFDRETRFLQGRLEPLVHLQQVQFRPLAFAPIRKAQ